MINFADRVIAFNNSLDYEENKLPENVRVMNPFEVNPHTAAVASEFYKKYYDDNNERFIILGINPGRFGAGLTGIPFTDPKRIIEYCNIEYTDEITHEPSSGFIYEMIIAYGGVESFYSKFYINSICPLGFTTISKKGNTINYNYYDNKELQELALPFIIDNIKKQIAFGVNTEVCFCLGTGKNYKFLSKLNDEFKFFKKIIPLDHPRYIVQYKSKIKTEYIQKYLNILKNI